jgi:hypothetical protein
MLSYLRFHIGYPLVVYLEVGFLIWEKGTNRMPLPSDFDNTLTRVQQLGITDEAPEKIRDRLVLAISEVAEEGQKSGDLALGDLGFFAQFIAVCRRSKMVSMSTRRPRKGWRLCKR